MHIHVVDIEYFISIITCVAATYRLLCEILIYYWVATYIAFDIQTNDNWGEP